MRFDTFWDDLSFCPLLSVCEGAETALSLLQRGHRCVWACGSAGAIERFPVIFGVGRLDIFADNDLKNLDTGFVAAVTCARRWHSGFGRHLQGQGACSCRSSQTDPAPTLLTWCGAGDGG